jgi:hypothetical protein
MKRLPMMILPLVAVTLVAQQAPPPAPPQNGGWQRFNPQDRPQEQSAPAPVGANDQAPPPPQQQPNFDQMPPAPPLPPQLTLPAGTWVTVRVNQPLSTDHNKAGDAFTVTLAKPLIAQGFVIARRGETIGGRVAESSKGGYVKGVSKLGLELTDLTAVDGQQISLKTELIQHSAGSSVGRDAAAIGTTTGVGAAIGAGVNGGVGAGVGAAAGVVAGTLGVLTTRGRATVVYPEETLTFRTTTPITIDTSRSQFAFMPVSQEDYEPRLQQRRAGPPPRPYGPPPPYVYGPYGYGYPYPYYYGPSFYFYSRPYYRFRRF